MIVDLAVYDVTAKFAAPRAQAFESGTLVGIAHDGLKRIMISYFLEITTMDIYLDDSNFTMNLRYLYEFQIIENNMK